MYTFVKNRCYGFILHQPCSWSPFSIRISSPGSVYIYVCIYTVYIPDSPSIFNMTNTQKQPKQQRRDRTTSHSGFNDSSDVFKRSDHGGLCYTWLRTWAQSWNASVLFSNGVLKLKRTRLDAGWCGPFSSQSHLQTCKHSGPQTVDTPVYKENLNLQRHK